MPGRRGPCRSTTATSSPQSRAGASSSRCYPADPAAWSALADERTICFFGESIPNPKGDILDIEPIAAAAHAVGVPLVVDNTIAGGYNTGQKCRLVCRL